MGAVLFVVSLFFSLGYVYYATVTTELREVDRDIEAEVEALKTAYEENGLAYIARIINIRSGAYEGRYLLETRTRYLGNLASTSMDEEGYKPFTLINGEPGKPFVSMRIEYTLENRDLGDSSDAVSSSDIKGFQNRRINALSGFLVNDNGDPVAGLIVGRDVEEIMSKADIVRNAIVTSSLIAFVLGLLSSIFVSRRFSRRIEAFNRLATDVRSGQLDRRAPRNYSEDELDLLADHLNNMLDHIDRLMKAMRYAGDSIAHDLRSPLTRLRTRLESTAGELNNQEASEALYAAADDADQLLSTFDKVLRIARLEAGEQREMLQELDPKIVLEDMAEFYEPACEDAKLEFSADIPSGLVILADRGLLSQAVSNLLENAIKYTPEGGKVKLQLERNSANRVVISVTDDGPGIPAPDRERVKERFVRLDKSRTAPGSGLGLAMVDAIATLHEAEFELKDGMESELGPGLSVQIVFPRRRHLRPAGRQKTKTVQ